MLLEGLQQDLYEAAGHVKCLKFAVHDGFFRFRTVRMGCLNPIIDSCRGIETWSTAEDVLYLQHLALSLTTLDCARLCWNGWRCRSTLEDKLDKWMWCALFRHDSQRSCPLRTPSLRHTMLWQLGLSQIDTSEETRKVKQHPRPRILLMARAWWSCLPCQTKTKTRKEQILKVMRDNKEGWRLVKHAVPPIQADKDIAIAAIQSSSVGWKALAAMSTEVRCDREVAMEAAKSLGDSVRSHSEHEPPVDCSRRPPLQRPSRRGQPEA